MAEQNDKPTLSLKKTVSAGTVKQSFTHGRKNTVEVQVKKRRIARPADGAPAADKKTETGEELSGLTEGERNKRLQVLRKSETSREQEQARREEQSRQAEERQKKDEERAKREAAEAKVRAEQSQELENVPPTPDSEVEKTARKSSGKLTLSTEQSKKLALKEQREEKAKVKPRMQEERRRSGKLTVTNALDIEEKENERMPSAAAQRRAREKAKRQKMGEDDGPKEKRIRDVVVPEVITIQELANRMAERATDVIRELMKMGMLVTANETIDADTAELVISEFGHNIKRVTEADVENILAELAEDNDTEDTLESRAPVVTIMGHVDHGKTSLLDALRETDVVDKEAGGITQHIGAYRVTMESGDQITFLDTPGHEAFTAMRSRGAQATDIVILVVAADDGIMEQTVEAINHAKAAEVPIIVAVNKIDKPEADASRVMNELLQHELVPESMGGEIIVVEVSAKQKLNLDKLEEAILLQAEMLELKANPNRSATGVVVESYMDKGKGAVATLLVQKGTLELGDIVLAGTAAGKVRAMSNDRAKAQDEAFPSVPVEVLGLDEAPVAGEQFTVVPTEKQAREIVEYRIKRDRDLRAAREHRDTIDNLFTKASGGGVKELPIIIKADVQGSAEAIAGSLAKLATDEVAVRVLHSAVGGITESDIILAQASNAIILGFNVRANRQAKELAEKESINLNYYSIIYNLVDDMKAILGGMLKPAIREQYLGTAEIRQIFNMSKYGKVAGCFVTDGIIKRGAGVRLLRDDIVIHEGKLKTLKRFKDDVKEVSNNFECGMAFENYEDLKEGDKIEAFELIEEQRTLE